MPLGNRSPLFAIGLFLTWTASASGDADLGRRIAHTPYDQYLGPVRKTFARFRGSAPTADEVRSLLHTAHRFRYYYDSGNPYVPVDPETTDATHQGDCKAKSLWLAWKMDNRQVRFVIGKATQSSRISHAWLLWDEGGEWYALDPTNESGLLSVERIVGRKLFPHYSYTARETYVHSE